MKSLWAPTLAGLWLGLFARPGEKETDDVELVREAKAGRRTAFDALVVRHLPSVLAYLRSRGAQYPAYEDLAQQTFIRAFLYLKSYQEGRPFVAWLLTIARNQMSDEFRRTAAATRQDTFVKEDAQTVTGPEELVVGNQGWHDRLRVLPEDQKLLLELRILQDVPFPELAALYGTSENALRVKFSRILSRLRETSAGETKGEA
ncbi:MAG: sigma-70 family RNA polymerase sigma factor [Candidatus Riflebacteria bacterium]|nr:sigma-70 family RNA polymerase sigma factor [Candidatus Riflebacteria bacterium]